MGRARIHTTRRSIQRSFGVSKLSFSAWCNPTLDSMWLSYFPRQLQPNHWRRLLNLGEAIRLNRKGGPATIVACPNNQADRTEDQRGKDHLGIRARSLPTRKTIPPNRSWRCPLFQGHKIKSPAPQRVNT